MGRDNDTPPTGTVIPRPLPPRRERSGDDKPVMKLVDSPPVRPGERYEPPEVTVSEPPPPSNPTIADVYKLIDKRLSPLIVQRISSVPPPSTPVPESRPSLSVRAAKGAGRWTKWTMAAIGVLTIVGEIWADVEKYRGPISQLLVFAAKQLDAHEAPELPPPEPE